MHDSLIQWSPFVKTTRLLEFHALNELKIVKTVSYSSQYSIMLIHTHTRGTRQQPQAGSEEMCRQGFGRGVVSPLYRKLG